MCSTVCARSAALRARAAPPAAERRRRGRRALPGGDAARGRAARRARHVPRAGGARAARARPPTRRRSPVRALPSRAPGPLPDACRTCRSRSLSTAAAAVRLAFARLPLPTPPRHRQARLILCFCIDSQRTYNTCARNTMRSSHSDACYNWYSYSLITHFFFLVNVFPILTMNYAMNVQMSPVLGDALIAVCTIDSTIVCTIGTADH